MKWILSFWLNVSTSLLLIISLKYLFTSPASGTPDVGAPAIGGSFVTLLHFFFSGLTVRLYMHLTGAPVKHVDRMNAGAVALAYCAFVVLVNESLRRNSVGTYQVLKLLSTVIVVVIQSLVRRVVPAPLTVISVVTVVVGVGIGTVTDLAFSLDGLIIGLLGSLATAIYQVLIAELSARKNNSLHNVDPLSLLYHKAPISVLILTVYTYCNGELSQALTRAYSGDEIRWLSASIVTASLYNISVFLCLGGISAAAFSVFGHIKTVIVILAGWAIFDNPPSAKTLFGTALAVGGMGLYSFQNTRERNAEKAKDVKKKS